MAKRLNLTLQGTAVDADTGEKFHDFNMSYQGVPIEDFEKIEELAAELAAKMREHVKVRKAGKK